MKSLIIPNSTNIHEDDCGGKAVGLSQIPRDWIPPYFVISGAVSQELLRRLKCDRLFSIQIYLESELHSCFDEILVAANLHEARKLIVRSSAIGESLGDRGKFISKICAPDLNSVCSAAKDVYENWYGQENQDSFPLLALLIQEYRKPLIRGNLSNERRVGRELRDWMAEQIPTGEHDFDRLRTFKIFKNRISRKSYHKEIFCHTQQELYKCLRIPAEFATASNLRIHYEWIWCGDNRIWIVQADREKEIESENPEIIPSNYVDFSQISNMHSKQFDVLIDINSMDNLRWTKARNIMEFKAAKLPTPSIWILEDKDEIRKLMNGEISDRLNSDINRFVQYPTVIRTDKNPEICLHDRQLSPRTHTMTEPCSAIEWLKDTSRCFSECNLDPDDVCFLFHHYIHSTSSAYCYASPQNHRVWIDAIWGLPDGLLYHAHDSFDVDISSEKIICKKLRYKEYYMRSDSENGNWKFGILGRPWDWKQSIGKSDIIDIAKKTKQLSDHLKSPIRMMWFVGLPKSPNLPRNLPWYYEEGEIPNNIDSAPKGFRLSTQHTVIRSYDDIEKLKNKPKEQQTLPILLYPDLNLLRNPRDTQFIEKVAELATSPNIPVAFQGSTLQHVYYQLKDAGVRVLCVDPVVDSRKEQRSFDGKLVRDRIPEDIKKKGEEVHVEIISGKELAEKIEQKIIEEAYEIYWSGSREELIDELADVFEVLDRLMSERDIDLSSVEKRRIQKREERGGFEKGIVLNHTHYLPLIKAENYRPSERNYSAFEDMESREDRHAFNIQSLRKGKKSQKADDIGIIPIIPNKKPQIIKFSKLGELGWELKVTYEKEHIEIELSDIKDSDVEDLQIPLPFPDLN